MHGHCSTCNPVVEMSCHFVEALGAPSHSSTGSRLHKKPILRSFAMSDKWGAKLQSLVPSAMPPVNVSARRHALQELEKISSIQVSCYGNERYAVQVSADSSRRELFSTDSTQSDSSTASVQSSAPLPTVHVEKELSEFTALRDKLYSVVYAAHYSKHCAFCAAILEWSVMGMNPDGVFLTMLGSKRVARKLTKYLADLVTCIVQHNEEGACSGRRLVPQVVYKFLLSSPSPSHAP